MLEKMGNEITDWINNYPQFKDNILSVIVFGSYVRGDFIEQVSDLDFFVVFKEENMNAVDILNEGLNAVSSGINYKLVDYAWTLEEHLDDPLKKGFPFKFLTYYQEDFLKNHHLLYGEDITDRLPRYDPRSLWSWRLSRLGENIERFKGRPEMQRIGAGETIRFLALVSGAKGISKDEILYEIKKLGDDESIRIFEAYISGEEIDKDEAYWVSFVESRISLIQERIKEASFPSSRSTP